MTHGRFLTSQQATRAGEAGRPFLGSTFSEMQAYESGKASAAGQIAGPAGGTLLLLALFTGGAACFWPIAGGGALVGL